MAKNNNYFTAGELASLYGIPKQTLLYYDKNKLLIPEFTNEKGYRFYSETQYHTLEIILNMRKLDIPVQEIKDYLSCRGIENFEHILREKEKECDKIIETMQDMKNSLQVSLKALKKIQAVKTGQIELATQKERLLLGSEILTDGISPKEYLRIFSRHNQAAFSQNHFKEFSTGWIIGKNDFFAEKFKTLRYFTPVFEIGDSDFTLLRREGLYVTMYFQGTFYQEILNVLKKIQDFMNRNYLEAVDNVYIFPLKNHWLTENTGEYLNEISFQVKEQQ
jgi:DNA-binding transcriptional MerR regulator/effector-binding domain-containing protein